MENRTFSSLDVRYDSEIEFCSPSWQRQHKYLSWYHWLITKSGCGKFRHVDRAVRYKLFELGHYAGSVILEIGVEQSAYSLVAVRAAREANSQFQYYAIDGDAEVLKTAQSKFCRAKADSRSVFFHGSLSEFRSVMPVTPTMVLINVREPNKQLLNHLALFLADGTPVWLQNWYQSRGDLRSPPNSASFEFCGRFAESVLLQCRSETDEQPRGLGDNEFETARRRFHIGASPAQVETLPAQAVPGQMASTPAANGGKKWPYQPCTTSYPATLPDGSPWPRISIVTPSYNQGRYIEDTINSVLNQGYPNLEYIVVDGNSTDETKLILERYRASFDHLVIEPDEGQSDAINKGMKLTTGSILTWLNSDDMFTPGTLHTMAMAFWKSKAEMVVGAVQFLQGDEIVGEHLTSCDNGPLHLAELLDLDRNWLQGRFFFQPELMFTRDLWERAGGYVDTSLFYSMDHELWLRFAIAGANMHVIGRPTVIYRVHDQQKTHSDYRPELRTVNQRYVEKFGLPTTSRLSTLSPKKYRVTFVNDLGPQFGAGIAHGRLQESLDAAGHETSFVFAKANGSTLSKTDSMLYEEIEKTSPDLVVFGNLHNASLGIGLVDWISERWPTCFVMHDLWLATGRCCYLGSCEKFKTNCDQSCPTAAEYPAAPVERIESLFDNKLRVISKPRKIVVLANSPWTARIAEQSAITRRGVVKTLKYGFPLHIFKPRDKNLCREILGLPTDAFIVLFASVNVAEERKGLRHLFEALNRLQLKNLVPVCIGHAHDHAELYPGTVALGYIEDPWRSALVYAAADIFAGPSLQEAFGQVFIEAAACGTPSVAYPVGGVENSIVHGVTGLLAARVHPSALADEIHRLYRDDEYRRQLGVWGRMEVENEWSYRSAYHRFNNILRQVPEHIGFLPPANIAFDPAKTAGISRLATPGFGILEKAETSVAPATGFGSKENLRLPSGTQHAVHWAIGNVCQIRVRIPGSQSKSLMATCFNPIAQQTISVSVDGQKLESIEIRNRDNFFEPIQVCLASEIAPGDHLVQLRFAKTIKEQSGTRDLAMLFADLELQPIRKERQEPGVAA